MKSILRDCTDEEIADPSAENQKKYQFAIEHFDRLNKWLAKEKVSVRYQIIFLSPKDYGKFFQKLRDKELSGFRSELDIAMRKTVGISK